MGRAARAEKRRRRRDAPRTIITIMAWHDHHHDHAHHHHDHAHDHANPAHATDHVHDDHCGPFARPDAGSARRSRRLEARPDGDLRGRLAALLGRDPGAGLRAGAGHLLGRRRGDLRDGARHRHHGRGDRDAHRHGDRPSRRGSPRRAPATARLRCAASRSRRPSWCCCSVSRCSPATWRTSGWSGSPDLHERS